MWDMWWKRYTMPSHALTVDFLGSSHSGSGTGPLAAFISWPLYRKRPCREIKLWHRKWITNMSEVLMCTAQACFPIPKQPDQKHIELLV